MCCSSNHPKFPSPSSSCTRFYAAIDALAGTPCCSTMCVLALGAVERRRWRLGYRDKKTATAVLEGAANVMRGHVALAVDGDVGALYTPW